MQNAANLFARLLMAAIFVIYGVEKAVAPGSFGQELTAIGLPAALTIPVIVLEIGGGLAVAFGLLTRLVAVILAAYCVATAFLVHFHPDVAMQMINFWKNVAMTGGFLLLATYGAGEWSFDRRLGLR